MKTITQMLADARARELRHRKNVAGLGYPLYVNGKLFPEPVTISHVPGVGTIDPSMGALGSYVAYAPRLPPLSATDDPLPGSTKASLPPGAEAPVSKTAIVLGLLDTAATVAGIYHGYKRNDSIGWALWWGFWAGAAPIVTIPVAIAQGFGKKKGMTPNRRSKRRRNSAPKNLRGAKNYLIGAGYTAASQLSDVDRTLLARSYGVSESDYPDIFKRASTTRRREAKRARGRSPWQALKRAVKRRRRR